MAGAPFMGRPLVDSAKLHSLRYNCASRETQAANWAACLRQFKQSGDVGYSPHPEAVADVKRVRLLG
jgi:hypothetical protein